MLYQNRPLFFKTLCVVVLPLVLASCSFKKEPESKKQKLVFVQQSLPEAPERSLEAIVAEDTDADIIESLPGFKTQIAQMRSGPVSILDLAIKHKKYDLLAYLIVTGESPFSLNEDSYRLMEYDIDLEKIISSAQKDSFVNTIRLYPRPKTTHYYHSSELPSMSAFLSRVSEMKLNVRGCESFVDYVLDFTYAGEKNVLPGVYYEALKDVQGKNLVKDILENPACRATVEGFKVSTVSRWLTKEFLYQFQNDFDEVEFIRFLTSLNSKATVEFKMPKVGKLNSLNHLNQVDVDPALLILLKGACFESKKEMMSWVQIALPLTSQKLAALRFKYSPEEREQVYCGKGEYCGFGTFKSEELDMMASYFYPEIYEIKEFEVNTVTRNFSLELYQIFEQRLPQHLYESIRTTCNRAGQ